MASCFKAFSLPFVDHLLGLLLLELDLLQVHLLTGVELENHLLTLILDLGHHDGLTHLPQVVLRIYREEALEVEVLVRIHRLFAHQILDFHLLGNRWGRRAFTQGALLFLHVPHLALLLHLRNSEWTVPSGVAVAA